MVGIVMSKKTPRWIGRNEARPGTALDLNSNKVLFLYGTISSYS